MYEKNVYKLVVFWVNVSKVNATIYIIGSLLLLYLIILELEVVLTYYYYQESWYKPDILNKLFKQ